MIHAVFSNDWTSPFICLLCSYQHKQHEIRTMQGLSSWSSQPSMLPQVVCVTMGLGCLLATLLFVLKIDEVDCRIVFCCASRYSWYPFELASILSEFGQELLGDWYTSGDFKYISSISMRSDRYTHSTTTTAGGKSRKKKQKKQARKSNRTNTNMKLCQMGC